MRVAFDRREKLERGLGARLKTPVGVDRAHAWALVLAAFILTGLADWASGNEVWFGPVYLLIIGSAAWFLGWREALLIGLTCMTVTFSLNGMSLYPYGKAAALWNLGARVGIASLTIGLVEAVRRAYAKQWYLARTDPLTGALNRQAFFELMLSVQRRGWSILAYLDLDGFKHLNDRDGHIAGDGCLKIFAERVKTLIRRKDIFARIGGDEFLIHMDIRNEAAAAQVALRLQLALNGVPRDAQRPLPCSIGLLILPPGVLDLDVELRLADQLMYEAKQSGASIAVATGRLRGDGLELDRHPELLSSAAGDEAGKVGRRGPQAAANGRRAAA